MLGPAGAAVAHRELDDPLDREVLQVAAGGDAGEPAAAGEIGGGEGLGGIPQRSADVISVVALSPLGSGRSLEPRSVPMSASTSAWSGSVALATRSR